MTREYLYDDPPEQDSAVVENFKGGAATARVEVIKRYPSGFALNKLSTKSEWIWTIIYSVILVGFLIPLLLDAGEALSSNILHAASWLIVTGGLIAFLAIFIVRLARQLYQSYRLRAIVEIELIGMDRQTSNEADVAKWDVPESEEASNDG